MAIWVKWVLVNVCVERFPSGGVMVIQVRWGFLIVVSDVLYAFALTIDRWVCSVEKSVVIGPLDGGLSR